MRYNHEGRKPRFTENPHFTLDEARRTLTIHATDVSMSAHPPSIPRNTNTGNTVRFTPELPTSKQAKDWKGKIGDRLCRRFLYLGGEGPKYRLTKFPPGYHLYARKEGTGRFEVKRSAILFGQTSGPKFQSPREATLHFAWLMRGKPTNRCKCVYCGVKYRAKQRPINEDEEKQWKAYQDKECKRNFEELNKRTACQKSGETYKAPPTPVDHFNEDMYLLPAIERL